MLPREKAMMGRIAASMTHELNNVLASIKESSGLMKDILAAKGDAVPFHDRFARALGVLERQVQRGAEICLRFNRFSHSLDHEEGELDANELLSMSALLMQRLARQRRVELEVEPFRKELPLKTKPTRLILACCACIDSLLAAAPEGAVIRLRALPEMKQLVLSLRVEPSDQGAPREGPMPALAPEWSGALADLGAELNAVGAESAPGLELTLPVS